MIGSLVPQQFRGRVVSVHKKAVNVLLPDGRLLGLLARAEDMTDLTVRLPILPPGAIVGAEVKGDGGRLVAEGWITVDCAGARRWEGRLAGFPVFPAAVKGGRPTGTPEQGGHGSDVASDLSAALLRHGARGGFLGLIDLSDDNPFVRRARGFLLSHDGLAGVVGLGAGFTPSGDDFLSGVLLGCGMSGRELPEKQQAAIAGALDRTNAAGRTLLWLALRGSFPAYLLRLAEDLARADSEACAGGGTLEHQSRTRRVEEAVRRATGFGETSGTDATVGLLWFLERLPAPLGKR
jgi:hypothetical protein